MKQSLSAVLAVATVLIGASAGVANARPRPHRGKPFEANKNYGLGFMLGEPTGLTGKYFLTESTALDAGIGDYDHYRDRTGLDIHVDYLLHPLSIASTEQFELPFYVGVGGRMLDFRQNADDVHALALGVRVPVGISFDFNDIPLDAFIEVAFVLDFFDGYTSDVGTDLDFAVGARYWFE